MEDFEDDDFSDLYADVEVQASSAISALHRLTEMPLEGDKIFENATRGDDGAGGAINIGAFYEHGDGGEDEGGGLTELPIENGDIREGGDGNKQRFEGNCGKANSASEYGAGNMRKDEGATYGTEKSVEVRGCNSQRKNLKYDSLDSKKRRVDEMAPLVYRVCKNGDADEDNDRDLYLGRAKEENQPIFGRNGGEASERGSRHAHAYDHVSLDSDKYGSVQISDSVKNSHHEVSECDSDGTAEGMETSDATNRRNASSISSSVPSADTDKIHKHSEDRSSSLVRDFEEEVTREYHPVKDSRRHCIKQSTRAGRYCERQRGLVTKNVNQHKKSNYMPDRKTDLTDEDASYVIDVKRPHNRHTSHGKRRAMLEFDSNEKDIMPYCNQPESSFNYSDGFLPHDHLGPAYLKNQFHNIHSRFKYKAGWYDGRNMGGRQNTLRKSYKMDCEALEDNRYHNQRKHVQCNSEQLQKVIPKYSSTVATRGTRFSNRGDAMRFRKMEEDYSSSLQDYDNKFINGKYRRFMPNGDRHGVQLDHRYDRNIVHDRRREVERSERGKRRCDNSLNSSHNLLYIETVVNDRRYIKRHKPDPERSMRCSWKEMDFGSGRYGTSEGLWYHHSEDHHVLRRHYQQDSKTYIMNSTIKDHHYKDHFLRGRLHQQSLVLRSRDEVFKSRHQDDTTLHSKGPSYHPERISRNNLTDDRHASGHDTVTELIDEREVDRRRLKLTRDVHNQFDGCRKFIQPHSWVQMHQRYRDSVDPHMVVEGKKPLQRTSEAGNEKYYDRHYLRESNDNQKSRNFEDLDDCKPEKVVLTNEGKAHASLSNTNRHNTFSLNQKNKFLDIEEGQIIAEEIDEDTAKCGDAFEDMTSNGDRVAERLSDDKIREIIVKMEKRRERFKEPIASTRDFTKTHSQLI